MKETINSRWSVRELQRQRNSLLYERLVLSSDKAKVLELSKEGQVLRQGKDLVKDPFVLVSAGKKAREQMIEMLKNFNVNKYCVSLEEMNEQ